MGIKDAKKEFVVSQATTLFLKKSISSVTIQDVALKSGVGEATVYRYFKNRKNLIIACAVMLQKKVKTQFLKSNSADSGYIAIKDFYEAYLKIFKKDVNYYRFLSEFDAFCIDNGVNELDEYADNIEEFKTVFKRNFQKGITEGTIRQTEDIDLFYYSTTHAILSLCKKLSFESNIIKQDKLTDKEKEIKTLIDIILTSIENKTAV